MPVNIYAKYRHVDNNSKLTKVHNDGANEKRKGNFRSVDRRTFRHMKLQSFRAMLTKNKNLERKLNNENGCGHLGRYFSPFFPKKHLFPIIKHLPGKLPDYDCHSNNQIPNLSCLRPTEGIDTQWLKRCSPNIKSPLSPSFYSWRDRHYEGRIISWGT